MDKRFHGFMVYIIMGHYDNFVFELYLSISWNLFSLI